MRLRVTSAHVRYCAERVPHGAMLDWAGNITPERETSSLCAMSYRGGLREPSKCFFRSASRAPFISRLSATSSFAASMRASIETIRYGPIADLSSSL